MPWVTKTRRWGHIRSLVDGERVNKAQGPGMCSLDYHCLHSLGAQRRPLVCVQDSQGMANVL